MPQGCWNIQNVSCPSGEHFLSAYLEKVDLGGQGVEGGKYVICQMVLGTSVTDE